MQLIGIALLVPIIIAIIYKETHEILVFFTTCIISIIIGIALSKISVKSSNIRLKHAMIISTLAWIWASFIGAIIMKITLQMPILDGMFENMSSWTGTGLCLFTNIEIYPKSLLFLKSYEGWLGGLGIVILSIGVLIQPGTAAAKLYKSEAREERIKPSLVNTMQKTIEIYVIYTIIGIILYLLAGMPLFDAINLCFATICTGGMSIKNANVGYYNNNVINIITIIIMILGAISFQVHYKVYKSKGKAILEDIQFKTIILIIVVTSIIIYFLTKTVPMHIIFTVVSAVTSTGATIITSNNLLNWGDTSLIFIMTLMLIGGSSGSTVGGLKVIRIITVLKGIQKNIREILSPEGSIIKLKIENTEISTEAVKEAGSYIFMFLVLIFISWIILILHGYNGLYSLFEVVSAATNNGFSTGITSVTMAPSIKVIMILDMLMGKLEILPVLVTIGGFIELFKLTKTQKNKIKSKLNIEEV
ncbi:TrkH family potassium uptake protein [Methanobrevibacter sp. 87.7]|uniref:TrkH family potassium uptake protein n=1 Tax=Methanobrevibacter sp. 87.7 TaxID=387957 RepID=UPI000B512368|nr:TrkH family potassium uptake protein [Methanobrevibacter sp. 87.7]